VTEHLPDDGQHALGEVLIPTLGMMAVLTLCSLAIFAVAVFAPMAALDMGVAETAIGIFSAMVYLRGMLSSALTSSLTRRFGPVRVSQLALQSGGVLGRLLWGWLAPRRLLGTVGLLAASPLLLGVYRRN